jgi:hypothetical protein
MYELAIAASSCSLTGVRYASTSSAGFDVALYAPVMIRAALYCMVASFSTCTTQCLLSFALRAYHTEQL